MKDQTFENIKDCYSASKRARGIALEAFIDMDLEGKKAAFLEAHASRISDWPKMEDILIDVMGEDEYDDWADENGIA